MNATTTQADRFANRAPKGGAISPVNGVYYRGGRFMPRVAVEFKAGPVALMGSTRQVAWANRLRAAELAAIEDEIHVARLFLAAPGLVKPAVVRARVRTLLADRHALMTEREAARVIERRAGA